MGRRFTFIVLGLGLAAAAAGYTSYWYYAAGLLRGGIDTWIAQRRAEGVEVRYATVSVGGFPFALAATADDVVAVGSAGDLAWEGRTPVLDMFAAPWNIHRLEIGTGGGSEATIVNIATGERATVTVSALSGGAAFSSRGRLEAGNMTLENLAVAGSDPLLQIAARALTLGYARIDPKSAEISVRGLEIALPPSPMNHLGNLVQSLTATLAIHGAVPQAPTETQLAAWRRDDGRVDIRFFEAVWGPVTASASGQARLDAALQPIGTLATSTRGYREAITAAESAGQLSPQEAAQTRLMLDLLATRPTDGGPPRLDVDLRIANRQLYAGILPVAELPHIDWPAE